MEEQIMNKIISVIALLLVLAAPATYAQQTTIEPVLRAGYEVDDNATLSILTIEPSRNRTFPACCWTRARALAIDHRKRR
jgi:hypothetical protein